MMLNETGDVRVVLKHKNGLAQLLYPRVTNRSCGSETRAGAGSSPFQSRTKGQRNCKRLMNLLWNTPRSETAFPAIQEKAGTPHEARKTGIRLRTRRQETL
jgi:hypothetical protein